MSQKTEKPTPKKLRDARKKGQVAVSKDLSGVAVFIVGFVAVLASGTRVAESFGEMFAQAQKAAQLSDINLSLLLRAPGEMVRHLVYLVMPILGVTAAVGIVLGLIQTQFVFASDQIVPKLNKLSPLSKLKQWFSVKGLFEYVKTVLKLVVVFLIGGLVVRGALGMILRLGFTRSEDLIRLLSNLMKQFALAISVVFAILALMDYMFQRWKWMEDLKMSKDEMKREFKQMEGDPQIKGARKAVHRELSGQDMRDAVRTATVVVTNPTHFAVALIYDREQTPVPMVTAKGQDLAARRIMAIAEETLVPIVRNPPIARALVKLELGHFIPKELFTEVATILREAESSRTGAPDVFASGGKSS